ncbi:hypothetical protein TruAng_011736 [Truncatella angustata]|nr:hypothetical protein TruAng_011736 [Truncatella angustata]
MEPGQSEAKRPRLNDHSPPTWTPSHQGPVLPPPQPSQHHQPSLSPYQSHNLYSRQHQDRPPHPSHHQPDDRRHHEQDSYPHLPPPMQDHRPPPSPAHNNFPPYRRESIVKSEAADESSLPHMRRPNSTGAAPGGLPPPHTQGPPPYPRPHMDDHRRPQNFENGGSIPPSPQVYQPPQPPYHPPPTPLAQHHQYEPPPPGYGPPPTVSEMYSTLPVASAKRKAQRASQACDMCRQLKAKCDEQRPCKNCKDKQTQCVYRDLPTKQPDKVSTDLLDLMTSLRDKMADEFLTLSQRMTRLEETMRLSDQSAGLKIESVENGLVEHHSLDNAAPREPIDEHPSSPRSNDDPEKNGVRLAYDTVREMDNDEIEDNPGPPINPGQPSLPANHTTLAALLLKWPSIEHLVSDLLQEQRIHHIDEFPISQEQQRGVLRVWGKGEGYSLGTRYERKGNQLITDVTEDSPDGRGVDAASPASNPDVWDRDVWGAVGVPPASGIDVYKGGLLLADGNPDFDRTTVKQYVKSFKDNVLNMHPILIPGQLDAMANVFLDTLPQATSKPMNKAAKFVQSAASGIAGLGPETGSKRKRSPALDEPNAATPLYKSGLADRSIHSAFVLSVLALGKICLHKDKIPELVQEYEPTAHYSPQVRNGTLMSSPSQGSPPGITPAHTSASGLPSPKEGPDRSQSSRRPSLQGSSSTTIKGQNVKRNADVVPGLEYFGLAADIFGSHIGGFTLKHVYTALFLGLYHGQLGRVLESYSYIATAGRTLQVVLRPALSRLSALKAEGDVPQSARDNQLAFAFWTCLQLESLASPDPKATIEEKTRDLEQMLAKSTWVPAEFQFADSDPPADSFLAARLRAKYWGSQNILYRKFIDMILHNQRMPEYTFRGPPPHRNDWAANNIHLEHIRIPAGTDPRALNYARLGISALVESTRAFHGLKRDDRILVTNVFTTAHAQWGNLLVLSACYTHDVLRQFINGPLLQELFSRTIDFFRLIAHQNSPLKQDLNLLIGLNRKLGFPLHDQDAGVNSSFSSVTSSGHMAGQTPNDRFYPGTPNMPPPAHGLS